MMALVSLIVCLASQPLVCESVIPDYVRASGEPPTFHECLGFSGQAIAHQWLAAHPGYTLSRVQCSIASDPARLREQIQSPEA